MSRIKVLADIQDEAERAAAGKITTNAAAAMVFLNVIGQGPADEKIKEEIIQLLRKDPNASDMEVLKSAINDIEAEQLIKSGNQAFKPQNGSGRNYKS